MYRPAVTHRPWRSHRTRASALLPTLVFAGIMGMTTLSVVELTSYRARTENARWTSNQAYYHAENALSWAVQVIADSADGGAAAAFLGQYSLSDGTLTLPYLAQQRADPASGLKDAWVTIENDPSGLANLYRVTVSAKVVNRIRTIQAVTRKNPPSVVFDYEYFLNNWGWWWGSSITGNGDNRANWDFDFKGNPTVNGGVLANGNIESNGVKVDPFNSTPPFIGLAGNDPISYVKSGVPRVQMPNLLDFTYYQQQATNKAGKLYVGTTLVVDKVRTDAAQPGLYLRGTATDPIKINGPVVIPGDVVISGPITGRGTLYVGGNLYLAGDMTYVNGPSFSTPPTSMTPANRDAWVQTAISDNKDLVAFAVREAILGGQVSTSDWKANCYDPASYGLKNVGGEASLGPDGIRGTPDDTTSYFHQVGTNWVTTTSYDADGDGIIDGNYNYTTQLTMDATRAGKIGNYPTTSGTPNAFDTVSTANFNRLDGVFYCNHAIAMRMSKSNAQFNGALICRDEAIIFTSTLKFNYDPRIHSRYSNDPNRYVDLGLPVAIRARIERIDEIKPVEGYYLAGP